MKTQPDPIMIDLNKHLESLHDSLAVMPNEQPAFWQDALAAIALAIMGVIGIALVFGFSL
jgi:hypothetical protein